MTRVNESSVEVPDAVRDAAARLLVDIDIVMRWYWAKPGHPNAESHDPKDVARLAVRLADRGDRS